MEDQLDKNIQTEEEGPDFLAIAKKLWDGRKTILWTLAVFTVIGLLSALTMKHSYSVSSVMVPQMNQRNNQLGALVSLGGFDIGTSNMSGKELSPLVYPQIVESVPFRLELLHTPLHFSKADTTVSTLTYFKEYNKPGVMSYVKKYTIGLPGTIMGLFKKEEPEVVIPTTQEGNVSEAPKPIVLTKAEQKLLPYIAGSVGLSVDKKEGLIILSVKGVEPLQTAELAMKAQTLLQEEVTRFRTQQAQAQLDYIQARYNEVKAEAESYQNALATITDRSQDMLTTRSRIEKDRLQAKYSIASSIYAEMAKQLEQAKMQVKRDTPMLTVVKPITVPSKPSDSRAKTLFTWIFLGILAGCGIVVRKDYLTKFKESLSSRKTEETEG